MKKILFILVMIVMSLQVNSQDFGLEYTNNTIPLKQYQLRILAQDAIKSIFPGRLIYDTSNDSLLSYVKQGILINEKEIPFMCITNVTLKDNLYEIRVAVDSSNWLNPNIRQYCESLITKFNLYIEKESAIYFKEKNEKAIFDIKSNQEINVDNYDVKYDARNHKYYTAKSEEIQSRSSAGYELRKASNHFYTGVICSFSGALIIVGGSFIYPKETNIKWQDVKINNRWQSVKISSEYDYTGRYVVMGCGAALSLVGIIYGIESFSHIYKAGIKLDKQTKNETGLYINNSNSNMTLTYRF